MDVQEIANLEKDNKQYAEQFFDEEEEMEGIFHIDIKILDRFITRKGKILDAAMGPGRHVKYFADKGLHVWGNDFNKHMIKVAKKYVRNSKVSFINHDMRNLSSLKNNYFDYVICMGASIGSIYKSSERQKAVSELARVTKKGCSVFIHVHNLFELTEFEDFVSLITAVKNRILHPNRFELGDVVYYHSDSFKQAYMHWFTPQELRNLMKNAGLRVEKEFYLKGPDQDKIIESLKYVLAGGFIFVAKKQ